MEDSNLEQTINLKSCWVEQKSKFVYLFLASMIEKNQSTCLRTRNKTQTTIKLQFTYGVASYISIT